MTRSRQKGFTLIELMVTVVIIGVLASIAYPSYQKYVTQTRRSDAQVTLTRIAAQQEKFYSDCGYYARTLSGTRACGTAGATTSVLGAGALSPDSHYEITLAQGAIVAANCSTWNCGFTATANPNGAGVTNRQKDNGSLRIDATGTREWNRNNGGTWVSWSYK